MNRVQYVEKLPGGDGVYYGSDAGASTQVVKTGSGKSLTFKTAEGFGGGVEEARECLDAWEAAGYERSPSSVASFFRQKLLEKRRGGIKALMSPYYANNLVRPFLHGGLIESRKSGEQKGAHVNYDINSAYFWAAMRSLPLEMKPVRGGRGAGALPWDAEGWACVCEEVETHIPAKDLPVHLTGERVLLTSEDVDTWAVKNVGRVVDGVKWSDEPINMAAWVSEIDGLPPASWKRLTQSFWGVLAQQGKISARHRKGGELKNEWKFGDDRTQHFLWAVLIVRRVMAETWKKMYRTDAVSCYCDSVLTGAGEIETGELAGEWSVEDSAPHGVYAAHAGQWCALDAGGGLPGDRSAWTKHAGISRETFEQNPSAEEYTYAAPRPALPAF